MADNTAIRVCFYADYHLLARHVALPRDASIDGSAVTKLFLRQGRIVAQREKEPRNGCQFLYSSILTLSLSQPSIYHPLSTLYNLSGDGEFQ